jgi:hypothetical protein
MANQRRASLDGVSVVVASSSTDTNLGAKADTAASTDTGAFSLIALVKRGLQSLTSIVTAIQGTLTANIAALPKSSTSNVPSIATGAGTVISANASRKLWSIQNVGTNPLFVRLGASASTTVFHFILKGGTADSDGNGAVITDDCYTGVVSVAGTSPKYTVTELT